MDEPTYIPLTKRQQELLGFGVGLLASLTADQWKSVEMAKWDELTALHATLRGETMPVDDPPPTTWAALTTLQVGERVVLVDDYELIRNGRRSMTISKGIECDVIRSYLDHPANCLILRPHFEPPLRLPGDPYIYLHAPMRGDKFDESQSPPIELVRKGSHGNAEDRT